MKVRLCLTVNGEVKQNGSTSQFIFTPEEQIEFASSILTLEPGDIFSCGTCGGVGQGSNTFLKAGDVMETEIEGLGKMRNQMVAEGGRDPDSMPITLFGGTEDAGLLKRYRDMGVARVVTTLPPEPAEKTLPVLDRWAELIRTVNS